jgi:hypothetical protein
MQITTIGLDIAKNVFQVHGIGVGERVVVRKQLRRSQVIAFFEALSPCLIGMEACGFAALRMSPIGTFRKSLGVRVESEMRRIADID